MKSLETELQEIQERRDKLDYWGNVVDALKDYNYFKSPIDPILHPDQQDNLRPSHVIFEKPKQVLPESLVKKLVVSESSGAKYLLKRTGPVSIWIYLEDKNQNIYGILENFDGPKFRTISRPKRYDMQAIMTEEQYNKLLEGVDGNNDAMDEFIEDIKNKKIKFRLKMAFTYKTGAIIAGLILKGLVNKYIIREKRKPVMVGQIYEPSTFEKPVLYVGVITQNQKRERRLRKFASRLEQELKPKGIEVKVGDDIIRHFLEKKDLMR